MEVSKGVGKMGKNKNRIGLIDGVRGFSLLGILLANLLAFQYGIYGTYEIDFLTYQVVIRRFTLL